MMIIEEHFSKTHSVHGLFLGLSEFWKSAPQLWIEACCVIITRWRLLDYITLDNRHRRSQCEHMLSGVSLSNES